MASVFMTIAIATRQRARRAGSGFGGQASSPSMWTGNERRRVCAVAPVPSSDSVLLPLPTPHIPVSSEACGQHPRALGLSSPSSSYISFDISRAAGQVGRWLLGWRGLRLFSSETRRAHFSQCVRYPISFVEFSQMARAGERRTGVWFSTVGGRVGRGWSAVCPVGWHSLACSDPFLCCVWRWRGGEWVHGCPGSCSNEVRILFLRLRAVSAFALSELVTPVSIEFYARIPRAGVSLDSFTIIRSIPSCSMYSLLHDIRCRSSIPIVPSTISTGNPILTPERPNIIISHGLVRASTQFQWHMLPNLDPQPETSTIHTP